ncbi:hypothetical protein [Oceanirhabdus seepicola]|uniref:Peptidase C39-like domain-containing protein n=1 Tax=Oceanirhabdus seepicola TaxID=2828781 RepID=A0A9J6P6L9_9CLOT|nr:hypothetical protein [Oceanirhabdus seepicola]MCM1991892.1 hypothetical protein [Oceanirhabdus seepicola]
MKKNQKYLLGVILSLLIIISSYAAYKNYETITTERVSAFKTWTIQLREDIEENININECITIEDDKGQIVENNKIILEGNTLKIYPPEDGYMLDTKYKVTLNENIESIIDKNLKSDFKHTFETRKKLNDKDKETQKLIAWGLGYNLEEQVQNDRDYEWYIDQCNTGIHSKDNCGPSSVTMAIKWADKEFKNTAEDARNTLQSKGGWWHTDDIVCYLYMNDIDYKKVGIVTSDKLMNALNEGHILLMCIDTKYLNYNQNSEQRVGKFHTNSGGHFLIVKGYVIVDGELYFTVYDPASRNRTYNDVTLKGKDRYYKADELVESAEEWWNLFFVIKGLKDNAESEDDAN